MIPLRKSSTPGPRGKRGIHLLNMLGKSFFACRIKEQRQCHPRSSNVGLIAHGFVKGRRRENAILVQQSACYRARKCKRFAMLTHHDLSNAFGSTDWVVLVPTVQSSLVSTKEADYAEQRVKWACIQLDTCQGLEDMRPQCGALMGGSFCCGGLQ